MKRLFCCPVCHESFKKPNKLEKHARKAHDMDIAAKDCEEKHETYQSDSSESRVLSNRPDGDCDRD